MDGVLVIDKPTGMTSHDVVARVRRALDARGDGRAPGASRRTKVGHAGTLDPDATGVLVVCLGRATRLVPYVQASRKTYDARMRLGVETTTLDAAGDVVAERDASGVAEPALRATLAAFVGRVEQVPPMVSAVKVGGERLYAKARRGEQVERRARTITVHDLVLTGFSPGPRAEAAFRVTCSAGTYVRTLAADVGDRLGVGAHLSALRRLASGRFTVQHAHSLDAVTAAADAGRLGDLVLSPAEAVADYPAVSLDQADALALAHGRPLPATGLPGPVAARDASGALIGVVQDRDGAARPLVVLAPAQASRP